jgi:hypothetical protein
MHRSLVRVLAAAAGVALTVLALPVSAGAASSGGWQEGFVLKPDRATACGLQGGGFRITEITATKSFDSRGRVQSSRFEFRATSGITPAGTVSADIGPVTVDVPGDPDYLSVSRDLGWAGLDASVSLMDKAVGHAVPVEIHLSLFAIGGVTRTGDRFQRPASTPTFPTGPSGFVDEFGNPVPSGRVVMVAGRDFLRACVLSVSIFSTQSPGARV